MFRLIIIFLLFFTSACSKPTKTETIDTTQVISEGNTLAIKPVSFKHAHTFQVYEQDNFKLIEFASPVVSWGGDAQGQDQTAKILLVPKDRRMPKLIGKLANSIVVRTPVDRIAVNYGFLESVAITLGISEKLVAVGGTKSYDDGLRQKVKAGKLAKIGYGWHMPPMIDPLLNSQPDVLLMVLGSLEHTKHMDRINALGIPVVPIFFGTETHYMGPVDYVRLIGMMTGKEQEANAFVQMVESNVIELKTLAASVPSKKVLKSWYAGNDRWMVTVRNADNLLLKDAGAINPLEQTDNIRIDDYVRLNTEVLLEKATDVDCWIIRDNHSLTFKDKGILSNFKAWQDGCLFAADGSSKHQVDAYDYFATGPLRPDLILRDLIKMLHPELIDAPFVFVQPDTKTPRI